MAVAADPYITLNLPHTASQQQIKRAYRDLARQYHPDRLVRQERLRTVTDFERERATTKFAAIAAAYNLLSDPKRKAEYDHIYKYGGFDNVDDDDQVPGRQRSNSSSQESAPSGGTDTQFQQNRYRKTKTTGIGYSVTDPFAFVWTQGKVQSTRTVAGVQIPSRMQMAHPSSGIRFAFSSGQFASSQSGVRKYVSRTTQFAQGKKFTRTETTTIHPDGRKEVVIEGDDYFERRVSNTTRDKSKVKPEHRHQENVAAQSSQEDNLPWYMNAWHGIKDKLTMCYNPCAVTA